MFQFLITLNSGKTQIINAPHPINFNYANMILMEMGHNEKAARITYIGTFDY